MELFRHRKHGDLVFDKIGVAEVQHSGERQGATIREGDRLVLYRCPDGRLIARPEAEFNDGRFTRIE